MAMERLHELLARQDGSIDYEVLGELTGKGHESLVLKISGTLWVKCQRCLEALPLAVSSARRIVFARKPLELEHDYEDDDTDVVDAVDVLNVAALIEDEVLLSLPPAPKHEMDVCGNTKAAVAGQKLSPFAVLGKLGRPPAEH
jgi:uncharacterized protein